jgi:Kef-type K+ transport system membrane component KefB
MSPAQLSVAFFLQMFVILAAVLNIGLQHGIVQPALFSVMVLMAIVTTLMASPVFEWVYGRHARTIGELAAAPSDA